MLQAYFDDSGSSPNGDRFVLAGYILPVEKWAAFSDDWDAELKCKPSIGYFKMSEAVRAHGEFALMPTEYRKHKVRGLLDVVKRHNPHGICSFLRWAEWKVFNESLPSPHKDPYGMLFFQLLDNVVWYQKNLGIFPQEIQLDFDNQGKSGRIAIEWFNRLYEGVAIWALSEEVKQIIEATPRMLSSGKYMPIQAADLLAWGVRTYLEGGVDSNWKWFYEELALTLAGGFGYSKESWNAIRSLAL